MKGIDPETGKEFHVPYVNNTIEAFYPKNWSVFEFISLCLVAFDFLMLFCGAPVRFFVCYFFIFRLGYNVFMGVILDYQSKHQSLARFYKNNVNQPTPLGRLLKHLSIAGANPKEFDFETAPNCLRTWLAFTHLENLILGTDGMTYAILCLRCFSWRKSVLEFCWNDVLIYAIGFMLIVFNLFTKKDAHRVVGSYAWYCGDFFFLANQKLTFDGVYLMFPHPMYTVGYTLYYGISMITQSYTVFFVSLAAHLCQMFFLFQFEDPHIQRIYPQPESVRDDSHRPELPVLTSDVKIWWKDLDFPGCIVDGFRWIAGILNFWEKYQLEMKKKKGGEVSGNEENENVGCVGEEGEAPKWLRSVAPFPDSGFIGMAASLVHCLLLAVGPTPAWLTVLHALLWAAIHNGYTLGLALYMQSKRILRQVRQNCAVASPCPSPPCEGESEGECESDEVVEPLSEVYLPSSLHRFSRWQRLYRYTSFMAVLSFAVSAWRLSGARLVASWVRWGGMKIFGVALIVFAAYTAVLVYRKIGRYGWYYGDFFFLPRQGLAPLRYDGIYRYFNHPLATTGCAWMYGLAALTISPHICLLAMACHLLVWVRLFFTERTHLLALYGTPCLRSHGGLAQGVQESLKRAVDEAARLVEKAKAGWEEIETGMQRRRERRRLSASAPAE